MILNVCGLMWLTLPEGLATVWTDSVLEELGKQLAAFCALHSDWGEGHLSSVIKNGAGSDAL